MKRVRMTEMMNEIAESRPRSPGRPKADQGLDTRADLLRVSRELFAAHGYAGTSVSDVGKRAGVTVPVIYQRFGNKAGLFVAVAGDVYAQGVAMMRASVEAATTFEEAVEGTLRDVAALHHVGPCIGAMVVTVLVEAERDPELGRRLKPTLRTLRQLCDDIAAMAPAELAETEDDRHDLSRALMSLFSGIMTSSILIHRVPDYERMVGSIAALLKWGRSSAS